MYNQLFKFWMYLFYNKYKYIGIYIYLENLENLTILGIYTA